MEVDLNACIRGDPDAWSAFVEQSTPILYRALGRTLSRGNPAPAAETLMDAIQDVFVKLIQDDYRLLRNFDPARASLERWLTVVACSAAIDLLRKKKIVFAPLPHPESVATPAAPATPDASSGKPDAGLLAPLTPRQRLVLRLLFEDHMSVDEAAAFLKVDAQTIRTTKHKAIHRAREFFGQKAEG